MPPHDFNQVDESVSGFGRIVRPMAAHRSHFCDDRRIAVYVNACLCLNEHSREVEFTLTIVRSSSDRQA